MSAAGAGTSSKHARIKTQQNSRLVGNRRWVVGQFLLAQWHFSLQRRVRPAAIIWQSLPEWCSCLSKRHRWHQGSSQLPSWRDRCNLVTSGEPRGMGRTMRASLIRRVDPRSTRARLPLL